MHYASSQFVSNLERTAYHLELAFASSFLLLNKFKYGFLTQKKIWFSTKSFLFYFNISRNKIVSNLPYIQAL